MTNKSKKIILKAQPRTLMGKKVKRLRRDGFIPANIFGQAKASKAVSLTEREFQKELVRHHGELGLVYLKIDNQSVVPVLVVNVDRHPVSNVIRHIELMRVNLKEAVETEVAIELVGETNVPNTVLELIRDSVKIKALPEDIPEKIIVDVSGLDEEGKMITLAELNYDQEKITLLVEEADLDKPVVILQAVEEEKVEEPEETVEAETGETEGATEGEGQTTATENKENTNSKTKDKSEAGAASGK